MTTVAYKDGVLAADRRVTFGAVKDAFSTKIARGQNGLIGVAGALTLSRRALRWFVEGETSERPAFSLGDKIAQAIIVRPSGALEFHDDAGWAQIETSQPYYALGTGAEFAYGAMASGASAVEAVEIASRFDLQSGDGVDSLAIKTAGCETLENNIIQAVAIAPTRNEKTGTLQFFLVDEHGRHFASALLQPDQQERFLEQCRRVVEGEPPLPRRRAQ